MRRLAGDDADDALATRLLDQTRAIDVTERERLYRDSGWHGFDPRGAGIDDSTRRPLV